MSGICEEMNSGLSNVLHFPRSPRQPVASRVSKTGKSHDLRWSCLCFLPLWGKPFWGPKNTSHSLKKICNSINSIASLIEQAAAAAIALFQRPAEIGGRCKSLDTAVAPAASLARTSCGRTPQNLWLQELCCLLTLEVGCNLTLVASYSLIL